MLGNQSVGRGNDTIEALDFLFGRIGSRSQLLLTVRELLILQGDEVTRPATDQSARRCTPSGAGRPILAAQEAAEHSPANGTNNRRYRYRLVESRRFGA